jgi:Zn-dependent protease
VLLQEPGPSQGDLNFSLFGIPVRIHPMFWLIAIMMGMNLSDRDPVILLIWVIAFFISILWHEMGHALVIRQFGFRPWITLYGMGGLASYDPAKHRRFCGVKPYEQMLISFAGPGAEILLAVILAGIFICMKLKVVMIYDLPFLYPVVFGLDNARLSVFFNLLMYVCVFWALVNLLPIYPLDGGQITRELLMFFNLRDGLRQSLMLSIFTAIFVGILAVVKWHSMFIPLFFGYLAFENYQALQAYSGRGRR